MGNWYDPISSFIYGPFSEEAASTPPAPKPAPEKPQQQEEESWYSDYLPSTAEVVQLASDAYTGLKNNAKVYSDKASDLYDYASKEVSEAADKAYTYAKEVYEENEEIIDAAAPIVLGPINGWIAKEAAEYVFEDEPEATPPPSQTEEPEQPVEEIYSDPKEEFLLSDATTDPVEEALDTTHARTVASNDTTEETSYRSEPTDTESAPTTTAKTTVVYTAPQQPKATQNVTTTPTTEIVEPVVVAKASTEATAEAARMTGTEPTKIVEQEKAIASNEPAGATTVTTTASTPPTETQQTDNGSNSNDDGYGDADEGQVGYASGSNSGNLNSSESGLAGLFSDTLGRTEQNQNPRTTSQSAGGNNTATNSELAANAASKMSNEPDGSNESNRSNQTNTGSATVNAGTQNHENAVASTERTDQGQQHAGLGVKLPGHDTQNNNDDDTATASTSSSSAALAAAVAAHFVRHDEGSSRLGTKKDDLAQAEGADKDSIKINGTGNPLENDSGNNQGNPDGNSSQNAAAVAHIEKLAFVSEDEDYPIVQVTKAIFTSASQISTFG